MQNHRVSACYELLKMHIRKIYDTHVRGYKNIRNSTAEVCKIYKSKQRCKFM